MQNFISGADATGGAGGMGIGGRSGGIIGGINTLGACATWGIGIYDGGPGCDGAFPEIPD